jgi:tetratricopeptide (TPR) repeat protein
LQAVVSQPASEYVLRAAFYYGLVLAEDGRYGEAIERLNPLIQQNPKFALVGEAQLRIGFCQMQSRNYAEATKVLQPLREHPQLGDRATWWLGRIQVAGADPANPAAVEQAAKAAVETIRQGLEKCKAAAQTDPDAKTRKGDITLELADTMQLAKQYKEAIQAYQQVVDEGGDRTEEAMQRQVTAMHMGGQYKESDDLAAKFQQKYPKSTLMPAVLFRMAENAYLTAGAAFANPALPNRQQELEKLYGEAIARYQRLLKEFPEFPSTNLARQGMATAYYRLGKYAEAMTALQGIPEADRLGELASVPYVLADCILRTLPPEADDALGAAELVAQIDKAVKLLEGFVGGQGAKPQPPDAMLKLAHCYRRMGAQLASPTERQKFLNSAREVCDKARQLYPQDASMGLFLLERARAQASQGDFGGAMGELGRFRSDPLKASPAAPLGLVRLSSLLRAQGRAPEAVQLMQEVRTAHEAAMAKDPARADWVAAVQYEHALAVKETGKIAEARAMFEALAKAFPGRPEAVNALWRAGQCVREESVAKLAAAEGAGAKPGASAQEIAAAGAAVGECLKALQQTAEGFVAQAGELAKTAQTKPASLRVLYEAAWCYRAMADSEINTARQKLARQTLEKVARNLATQPAATSQPALAPPEVPLASIPVQPSEKLTQGLYDRLIAAAPESPLANQARFELAELLSRRGSYDAAQELLAAAMERSPSPEMAERIRVRLASSLLAQNNIKEATNQLGIVLKNPRSPAAAEAQYLMGETYILQKDWTKAVEQLLVFRDQAPFLYRRGISDRALHRLGYAYGQLGNWDASRSALRVIVERFPNSPVADEARYGIGWASQMLKQPDQAIAAYVEVTHRTAGEVAARAQFQIGLCRLEQNNHVEAAKALLVVPYTYDYPELSAAAWCEAGRAYAQMRQPAEAVKAWQRTIQDYPQSQWAKIAQQRLAELK